MKDDGTVCTLQFLPLFCNDVKKAGTDLSFIKHYLNQTECHFSINVNPILLETHCGTIMEPLTIVLKPLMGEFLETDNTLIVVIEQIFKIALAFVLLLLISLYQQFYYLFEDMTIEHASNTFNAIIKRQSRFSLQHIEHHFSVHTI